MIHVDMKPLSSNRTWLGRRRKTQEYKDYEAVLLEILEDDIQLPAKGSLFVFYRWGLGNDRFDIDNPIKPLQDILQTRYHFNDARITTMLVDKIKVDKGNDFIEFEILPRNDVRVEVVNLVTQEVLYEV